MISQKLSIFQHESPTV